jgi:hypothetical protein
LRDAQSNLRNALAYAARTEESYVNKHIADMLSNIDSIISVKDFIDKIEDEKQL